MGSRGSCSTPGALWLWLNTQTLQCLPATELSPIRGTANSPRSLTNSAQSSVMWNNSALVKANSWEEQIFVSWLTAQGSVSALLSNAAKSCILLNSPIISRATHQTLMKTMQILNHLWGWRELSCVGPLGRKLPAQMCVCKFPGFVLLSAACSADRQTDRWTDTKCSTRLGQHHPGCCCTCNF